MKIVYAYVCGDIIHVGHLLHLENSKALGDKLIVGVLTDEAIMQKKVKPVIPFPERIKMVQAIKCVDCAVAQATYSPYDNIMSIKPDILVESTSHNINDIEQMEKAMKTIGGKVIALPYCPGVSSTDIKKKSLRKE